MLDVKDIGSAQMRWKLDLIGIRIDTFENLTRTHFLRLKLVVITKWESFYCQVDPNHIPWFKDDLWMFFLSSETLYLTAASSKFD